MVRLPKMVMTPKPKFRGEQLILDRIARDEKQDEYKTFVNDFVRMNKCTQMLDRSELIMTEKVIKQKIKEKRKDFEIGLEMRRDRLRALLVKENEQYISEIKPNWLTRQEAIQEIQTSLAEKLDLKTKEVHEFAKNQYDALWAEGCDELRDVDRKINAKVVHKDNLDQQKYKDILNERKADEDKYFADLAEHYEQMRTDKVEKEHEARRKRCKDLSDSYLVKINEKDGALTKLAEQKRRDQEIIRGKMKELELEKEKEKLEKIDKQNNTRQFYDDQIRLHKRKLEADRLGQEAFDDKLLEQVKDDIRVDEENNLQTKRDLRDDFKAQIALKKQKDEQKKKEEAFREKVMENYCKEYNDKILADKRYRYGFKQHNAAECNKAIKEMIENKKKSAEMLKLEDQMVMDQYREKLKEIRIKEKEYYEKLKMRHKEYEKELLCQITYNNHVKELDKQEKQRERLAMQEAEKEYKRKIQEALNTTDRSHHYRNPMALHLLQLEKSS